MKVCSTVELADELQAATGSRDVFSWNDNLACASRDGASTLPAVSPSDWHTPSPLRAGLLSGQFVCQFPRSWHRFGSCGMPCNTSHLGLLKPFRPLACCGVLLRLLRHLALMPRRMRNNLPPGCWIFLRPLWHCEPCASLCNKEGLPGLRVCPVTLVSPFSVLFCHLPCSRSSRPVPLGFS